MFDKPLVNKVSKKPIKNIDLETFFPKNDDIAGLDIKNFLFKELVLKEKLFRTYLKNLYKSSFSNKWVYVYCSNNAIIPMWAYMLIASNLQPVCKAVFFASTPDEVIEKIVLREIENLDVTKYRNQRILIKGCGKKAISPAVYMAIQQKIQPIAKAVSYGEACSTVPLYKNK